MVKLDSISTEQSNRNTAHIDQLDTLSMVQLINREDQKVAGAVYLSQIGSVTAITGAAVAIFLLGEQGSASMLLAALCTTVGVTLVALRPAR